MGEKALYNGLVLGIDNLQNIFFHWVGEDYVPHVTKRNVISLLEKISGCSSIGLVKEFYRITANRAENGLINAMNEFILANRPQGEVLVTLTCKIPSSLSFDLTESDRSILPSDFFLTSVGIGSDESQTMFANLRGFLEEVSIFTSIKTKNGLEHELVCPFEF